MRQFLVTFLWLPILLLLAACGPASPTSDSGPQGLVYDFVEGPTGWVAGFADLPTDYDPEQYELDGGFAELPDGLAGQGLCIQGHNRSDELFMFFKTQVNGLRPDTAYETVFAIDLATNIPEGLVGIGGAPGESVFVKVGASPAEPGVVVDDDGWLRMNIDKGNQAQEGEHMVVVGNIAHPSLAEEGTYAIKSLNNAGAALAASADRDGQLWLIVGTDSGFEGLTAICYAKIAVTLTPVG